MDNARVIALDFDGTLCEDRYPEIGPPRDDIIYKLWAAQADGAKAVLWTCREGPLLAEAVSWCADHGIEFAAVNQSTPEWVAHYGTDPRKIGATEYWDDRAVRCAPPKTNFDLITMDAETLVASLMSDEGFGCCARCGRQAACRDETDCRLGMLLWLNSPVEGGI